MNKMNEDIHLVMLGDSVFDNGRYVPGEPDVHSQVSEQLKLFFPNSELTFVAEDGAVIRDVFERQFQKIPEDATHVALSIGGNDLLGLSHNLQHQVGNNFQDNLIFLSNLKQKFLENYQSVIQKINSLGIPFVVCTIYYAGSIIETENKRIDLGHQLGFAGTDVVVDTFDAAISQVVEKVEYCKGLIDLRFLFDTMDCYANPIEPSRIGGEKITEKLIKFVQKWSNG